MRYIAEVAYEDYTCEGEVSPCIQAAYSTADESLALRHARAMAAVVRAAKAEQRARKRVNRLRARYGPGNKREDEALGRLVNAYGRLANAVSRLERVEREVGRG